jgi:hypothetical protein
MTLTPSFRKLLTLALLALPLLLVPATRAHASTTQVSMFQDDPAIESNPQYALGQVRQLGGTMVKLWLNWSQVAPARYSRRPPRHFNASNPSAYPRGAWNVYDRVVRDAAAKGIGVNFDIGIGAPIWATGPGAPRDGQHHFNWEPSPSAFGAFVRAAARRYSGTFRPSGSSTPLPRVSFWSIWNEPNLGFQLAPQGVPGHLRIENSGRLYRGLLNAAWTALHQTGHGQDTILMGDLGPRGNSFFGVFSSMKPLQFLRALYCVDSHYRQLRGSAAALRGCPTTARASRRFRAQNPALFSASGLALHFWSRWYAPNVDFEHDPDYAGLPQIPHVQKILDTLQRAYRSNKKLSIYNTEYGYLTDPPNPDVGYPGHPFPSPATAAAWLNWAEYLEWKNPRIQSFAQYVLADSPSLTPGPYTGWSSGLITYKGEQKPTYGAWRMPLYLPSTSTYQGGSLEVWGCLRPARYAITETGQGQTAQIQFAPSGSSDYTTVATAGVNDPNNCYFDRRIQFPGSGTVRVQWGNASSSSSSSSSTGYTDPFAPPTQPVLYSRTVAINVH